MLTARQEMLSYVLARQKAFSLLDTKLSAQEALQKASKGLRKQMLEETRAWKLQNLSVEYRILELDKEITELAKAIEKAHGQRISKPGQL